MANEMISNIIKNIGEYGAAPGALQRDALEVIRKVLNNENGLISAENPVALCLEMSAIQTAGSIGKSWLLNRRQYPISALTHEDLYYHLSDLDWVGVFGYPSKAKFVVSFEYEELIQILKPLPDGNGSLLRIPKGMQITVGGIDFLLDYPINILQLKHGGFRVTYDTEEKSPIQTLSSNILPHEVSSAMLGMKRLSFVVEMVQCKEITIEEGITANLNIGVEKTFTDFYSHSRVWHGSDGVGWKELKTTHCPDIYDPYSPTAILRLIENIETEDYTLKITVPKVYNQQIQSTGGQIVGTLGSRIRASIYTTLGDVDINLDAYTPDQYKYDFYPSALRKNDYSDLGGYSSALKSLRSIVIFSRDHVNQGRDPLTFEELRERVINNTVGQNEIPVSHRAITDRALDEKFKIIKAVDYVTNRAYWAVRGMPQPESSKLITPAAASIETLTTTIANLVGSGTTRDNGPRVTITPESIYSMNNGKMNILNLRDIKDIQKMSVENRAKRINSQEMFYSPFHYVVDNENDTIKLRPYYLDGPECLTKYYNDSNQKIDISLTVSDKYSIRRSLSGYIIRVEMQSNDVYKKLDNDRYWAQLLIKPSGDKANSYIQGKFIGRNKDNEPIFEFEIKTNFDVDDQHNLIVNNLSFLNVGEMDIPVRLEDNFELLFGFFGALDGWTRVQLDDRIGFHLLGNDGQDAKALLSESLHIRLGYHLKWLWSRGRTYADDVSYQVYTKDVPALYTEDVYGEDKATNSIINIVNGKPVYTIRHRKGTPILDNAGKPIHLHREGDPVLDDNGQPVVKEPRKIIRRLELMVIDATYWFATDDIAGLYRNELVKMFIDWLVSDLSPLNEKTLEQTGIFFYPSATMGQLRVIYNNGIETYINAAQSLVIHLTVSRQVYNNPDILQKIRESTIAVLNNELSKETVSISTIIARLVKEHGDDVIGLNVTNLGGNDRIVSFTVMDEGKRATIRKRLNVQSDETLSVVEDVSFNFIVHSSEEEKIQTI